MQRNNKLILGNLGMPGHTHIKWKYQFEETFNVYLQAKNQFYISCFPWDITKTLEAFFGYYFVYFGDFDNSSPARVSRNINNVCKFLILGTLDIPGNANLKW